MFGNWFFPILVPLISAEARREKQMTNMITGDVEEKKNGNEQVCFFIEGVV
jgi:hypothetical protein